MRTNLPVFLKPVDPSFSIHKSVLIEIIKVRLAKEGLIKDLLHIGALYVLDLMVKQGIDFDSAVNQYFYDHRNDLRGLEIEVLI